MVGNCVGCVFLRRGRKWVRVEEVLVQGGLGKPLGYGSPRGWNSGMPFLLPCIDVNIAVVAVGSPDTLGMSVCRVVCWLCALLLAVCLVGGGCEGQSRIIECLCLFGIWRLCAFTVC